MHLCWRISLEFNWQTMVLLNFRRVVNTHLLFWVRYTHIVPYFDSQQISWQFLWITGCDPQELAHICQYFVKVFTSDLAHSEPVHMAFLFTYIYVCSTNKEPLLRLYHQSAEYINTTSTSFSEYIMEYTFRIGKTSMHTFCHMHFHFPYIHTYSIWACVIAYKILIYRQLRELKLTRKSSRALVDFLASFNTLKKL